MSNTPTRGLRALAVAVSPGWTDQHLWASFLEGVALDTPVVVAGHLEALAVGAWCRAQGRPVAFVHRRPGESHADHAASMLRLAPALVAFWQRGDTTLEPAIVQAHEGGQLLGLLSSVADSNQIALDLQRMLAEHA